MNPINRRGQKVRCICDIDVEACDTRELYPGPSPREGQTYTVAGFINNRRLIVDVSNKMHDCGLDLVEVPPIPSRVPGGLPLGWPIECFVPVDDRETDISSLEALAIGVPKKKMTDA